jgi:hypothetical protein
MTSPAIETSTVAATLETPPATPLTIEAPPKEWRVGALTYNKRCS